MRPSPGFIRCARWVIALTLALGTLAGLGGVTERLTGRQAAGEPLRYAAHVAAAEALGAIGQPEAAGWQWRRAFAHTSDSEGRVAALRAWRRLVAPGGSDTLAHEWRVALDVALQLDPRDPRLQGMLAEVCAAQRRRCQAASSL